MYSTLLVVVVVLQSITLVVLAALVVVYARSLDRAGSRLADAAEELRNQIAPVAEDLKKAIGDADNLVLSAKNGVDSFSRVTVSAERLIEAASLFSAAERAVTSSKITLATLLQGVKAGLQVFRNKKDDKREVSEDGA